MHALGTFEIVRPEGVNASWMTRALQGRQIDAVVKSFRAETVGVGQLGDTVRFHLEYDGNSPLNAPKSLVGKFPALDPNAAASGKNYGLYRVEVMFYRELAHRAKIRTPAVYVAEIDRESNFLLLFEDLAPAKVGDQLKGCSVDEARLALKEAALLHASTWNDPVLMANPSWLLPAHGSMQSLYTTEFVEKCWAHVKKTYPDYLTPEVYDVGERFARNHAYWNKPRNLPKSFSHNDFRPDNMLFGGPDGRVAIVDWQIAAFLGIGMDVAFFIGTVFDRDTRRANEQALLRSYYDELIRNGVTEYSFDQLTRDYAHYSFGQFVIAVTATVIAKRTQRGDTMLMQMAASAAHQAIDNNALDEFPD